VKLPSQLRLAGACGAGWNEPLVPDRWGEADFTPACRAHDACYETCGASKGECDSRFRSDLRSACRRGYRHWWQAQGRAACLVVAEGYALAVERLGGDAYRDAQRAAGC
jgi:secretory phospholipase A2